jgi:hypothetical protein
MICKCYVTDSNGNVKIMSGDLLGFVSKIYKGPHSHCIIGYYKDIDDAISKRDRKIQIFPIDSVYFGTEGVI